MTFRDVIRTFASASAIVISAALLGAFAGAALAGLIGAQLGLIAGAVLGLALGIRYSMDMADIAAAKRDWYAAHSLEQLAQERRGSRERFTGSTSSAYLRDRRGEIWAELAAKRVERLTRSPYSRFTSQRHHDLDPSDIGIRRKRKSKR